MNGNPPHPADGAGPNGRGLRVLLVDDSPMMLDSLRSFLTQRDNLELVGVASNGVEALHAARTLRPDLVLIDYRMPKLNGFEATWRLKVEPDPPRVVILTIDDTEPLADAALKAGADGLISKTRLFEELLPFLRHLFPDHQL